MAAAAKARHGGSRRRYRQPAAHGRLQFLEFRQRQHERHYRQRDQLGLRPAWREAAENLGARTWDYWRYVGGPVLLPFFLGCVLLLFGSALSAYATTEVLTNGTIPLMLIQIGSFLNGNVGAVQVDRPSAESAALAPGASVSVTLPGQPVLVTARRDG